jgi:hypothetical protein
MLRPAKMGPHFRQPEWLASLAAASAHLRFEPSAVLFVEFEIRNSACVRAAVGRSARLDVDRNRA